VQNDATLRAHIEESVRRALAEDVGDGDVTAELVPADANAVADIGAKGAGVFCGRAWVEGTWGQLDPRVRLTWDLQDGDRLAPNARIVTVEGPVRALLTGERTALNFLQLLSGTATASRRHADMVAGTRLVILDTRKTLPGLRLAQKYAVRCGGCRNHRMGLYDAFLIKENHIAAAGSIGAAIEAARNVAPEKSVEIEVEGLEELDAALEAGADHIMLDDFDLAATAQAVARTAGRAKLEASGNVDLERLPELAATGVDFVSVGALTKNVQALDLSMRLRGGAGARA